MALAAVSDSAERFPTLCRDCFAFARLPQTQKACGECGSRRLVAHGELDSLTITHIDCDAFYASVEQRDRPELRDRPLIVGGGARGVVATACYRARISGVKSAMPMFRALALCPDAVVITPNFAKYAEVAREIRARMHWLTPLVQPLSIDEAVLDLGDSQVRHGVPPAVAIARFARAIERELGITVSIGLGPNRLLAKIAVEQDKPRGFAVIGRTDARAVLAPMPARALPGVGPAEERRLMARGITRLGDLQGLSELEQRSFGRAERALVQRARGEDSRPVCTARSVRSISVERTLEADVADRDVLLHLLSLLAERLAQRLDERGLVAHGLGLKLRTRAFRTRTRHSTLARGTARSSVLLSVARRLLLRDVDGQTRFRLVGMSAEPVSPAAPSLTDLAEQASEASSADRQKSGSEHQGPT